MRDRNVLEHIAFDLTNGGIDGCRIEFCADRQLRAEFAFSNEVAVDGGRRRLLKVVVLGIGDDSDDFECLLFFRHGDVIERDTFPDGIFVAEAIASGGLVDDCDAGAGLVAWREIASREKRRAIRLEIVRGNVVDRDFGCFSGWSSATAMAPAPGPSIGLISLKVAELTPGTAFSRVTNS